MTKSELRYRIKSEKTKYSDADLQKMSDDIICKVLADADVLSSQHIMLYYPLADEVNTIPLIEHLYAMHKTVYLPVTVGDDIILRTYEGQEKMQCGAFRIMEPTTSDVVLSCDWLVVIVPGVAFDKVGHRLGRGRGYYDRWFASCKSVVSMIKIGVCFPFQMMPEIPYETHDVMMDRVVC